MADDALSKLNRISCPYFSKKCCKTNVKCPFVHDCDDSFKVPQNVCLFHLVNKCHNGSNCSFLHLNLKDNTSFKLLEELTKKPLRDETFDSIWNTLDDNKRENSLIQAECEPDYDSNLSKATLDHVKRYTLCQNVIKEDQLDCHQASNFKSGIRSSDQQKDCSLSLKGYHCFKGSKCSLHGAKCDVNTCLNHHLSVLDQQGDTEGKCQTDEATMSQHKLTNTISMDKVCGICMELILEKKRKSERRFGILEKCDHVFCLSCIRQWRKTEHLARKTIRSCPECRVFSSFVIPSKVWYSNSQDKKKIIKSYKQALSAKPCKYFNQGQSECPFGGSCFYLHAYPDGTKAKSYFTKSGKMYNFFWNSFNFIFNYWGETDPINSQIVIVFGTNFIPIEVYDSSEVDFDCVEYNLNFVETGQMVN